MSSVRSPIFSGSVFSPLRLAFIPIILVLSALQLTLQALPHGFEQSWHQSALYDERDTSSQKTSKSLHIPFDKSRTKAKSMHLLIKRLLSESVKFKEKIYL